MAATLVLRIQLLCGLAARGWLRTLALRPEEQQRQQQ